MALSLLNEQLNEQLYQLFPTAFWRGNPARREIALTFDDGPNAQSTPALLRLLDLYHVRATFFQIGQRAERAPHLVRQVAEAGHQIGLHSYAHQSFWLKSEAELLQELAAMQQSLAVVSGRTASQLNAVRPPFGHFTPAMLNTLNGAGYLPTMWTVVPFHWLQSAAATVEQTLDGVGNGTILVLHEGLPGPPVWELTVAVLPHLLAAGYRFVTIHQLWTNRQQDVP